MTGSNPTVTTDGLQIPVTPQIAVIISAAGAPTVTVDGLTVPTVGSTVIPTVASIANLRALSVATLTAGQLIYLSGYYAGSTTGAGFFLVTTQQPAADNGGTIIWSSTTGYYFLRQVPGLVDPYMFGALGNGTANDSAAITAMIAWIVSQGGGAGRIPEGDFFANNITVPSNVRLIGDHPQSSIIQSFHSDAPVILLTGLRGGLENLSIFGKGLGNDPVFGATNAALTVSGTENRICNCVVWGGGFAIYITGTDNVFEQVNASYAYSYAVVASIGPNWHIRCKYDQNSTNITVPAGPYSPWAASTSYSVGNVVSLNGYLIQCSTAGQSNTTAPALSNYGITINDNTAQWLLLAPATYEALFVGGAFGENHLVHCDFTGPYSESIVINGSGAETNGPNVIAFTDCVFGSGMNINVADNVSINQCEIGGTIGVQACTCFLARGCYSPASGSTTIEMGAGVSDFVISNNFMNGGTIKVDTGSSDHYNIVNNLGATVTDGGTGSHKTVSGNN